MEWLNIVFDSFVAIVSEPFSYFIRLDQRIYWLHLFVALLLAAWIFIHLKNEENVRPLSGLSRLKAFGIFCFPKKIYYHESAKIDYLFFFINHIAFPWLVAPLILGMVIVSQASNFFFMQFSFLTNLMGTAGLGDQIALTFGILLTLDAALYVGHYLQHRIPILWEFHKVHHSAQVLTPITVYRMHPIDDLLTGSLAGIFTGILMGVFDTLYSSGLAFFTVAGLNAGVFAFYIFGYNLRHSHIWLTYHPVISHIFISPAQHQMHHSVEPKHYGCNLGFIFAFWDWIARTLYVPRGKEKIEFGLADEDPSDYNSVYRLYWRPFVRVYRYIYRRHIHIKHHG